MMAVILYAEPTELPQWSVRIDHPALAIQHTGLTTAQMLADISDTPADIPIRVHVADLTSPIGVLPSGRTVYADLSVTP